MNTGFNELNVPLVVTPSNMSSPELDELSSITYLSYYMKEDSPGYKSTLNWIQSQMTDEQINNFSV
jgi:filamin